MCVYAYTYDYDCIHIGELELRCCRLRNDCAIPARRREVLLGAVQGAPYLRFCRMCWIRVVSITYGSTSYAATVDTLSAIVRKRSDKTLKTKCNCHYSTLQSAEHPAGNERRIRKGVPGYWLNIPRFVSAGTRTCGRPWIRAGGLQQRHGRLGRRPVPELKRRCERRQKHGP